jgi:N-acetylmuramoyl-L-alanine amidase
MLRAALRGAALAMSSALLVGLAATPSLAAGATVTELSPTFGPVDAGAPVIVDDTHVQSTVPTGATSGPLTVTTADGSPSMPFTVQLPTTSTIQSPSGVTFPGHALVQARLSAAGAAVPNQQARLQRRWRGSSSWRAIRRAMTTDSNGEVHWLLTPRGTADYRVVFADSTGYLGTTTGTTRVHVLPLVTLKVPSVAPILTKTVFSGRLRPVPTGGRVALDRRPAGGTWQNVGTTKVGHLGRFHFHQTLDSTGRYAYRVRRAPDTRHGAGVSRLQHLRAVQRSVHSGMSGPDVRALQHQLAKLHYDVGAVNGTFGFDTQHAVTAFEKVQRMPRDGVAGPKVWQALAAPRVPHLRYPSSASTAGIEVDIPHQVVYYAVHGHIVQIYDSSTGGGYYYTGSDGTTQQAITPTGHFSIVYMREGWVTSKLGTMWRPAYFNNAGDAIHGETEVPPYPASHGCVRVTVPARDRLGSKLYDGLSVWIY